MDNRTFKVAGISTDPKGSTKVRFANDYVGRIKILNMRKTHRHQIAGVGEANEQERDL